MFFKRQVMVNIVLIWRSPTVDGFFFASGLAQYETDWVIAISHRKHRQHLRNTQVTINIIIFIKKKIILILVCFFFANVWHNLFSVVKV